jgi:aminoglycoside 3-N-acetyltransferase
MLTKSELNAQFRQLGLTSGDVVIVHSSLAKFGYVLGGAQTVVSVLLDILGIQGTLVMPAFSPHVSDPKKWAYVNFQNEDLEKARKEVPLFEVNTTPTTMGIIPEVFRTWPGTIRSSHPQVSVCANGLKAEHIVTPHGLEWGQGAKSPFERLYLLNAKVLILGVGFNRITLLHYAESLIPNGRRKTREFPVNKNGKYTWLTVKDVGDDLDTHFPIIGEKFIEKGKVFQHQIGNSICKLMSSEELVDFSVKYFENIFSKNINAAT